jgi:class 3 adenylate cyclase
LWIGTESNGLFLIDVIDGKLNHYKHQSGNSYSLGDNLIHTIFKDYSGVIWVGTDNNGVSKFDFIKQNIKHIPIKRDDTPGLSSKIVWSISEDNNGNILIGTDKSVDIINRFSSKIQNRNYSNTGNIQVINTENNFLIGTSNSLYQIDLSNPNYVKNLFEYIKDSLFIAGISVHEIKSIDENNYWLGTTKGLIKFNINTREYKLFNKKNSNLFNEDIRVILKTSKQEWWIGSEGGLYKMYVINDEQVGFTSYLPSSSDLNSISGSVITSIEEGSNGNLWIGTYDGALNFMDIKTKKFTNFSVKDGLSNNAIYGILKADNKLWISTNKGISVLDEKTLKFTNYYESDGLQSNEFNAGAFFKTKYGELFFGGVNGVSHFFPRELKKNTYKPKLTITSILVNNEPLIKLNKYKNKSVSKLKRLELNYKENNLTINLSALHFSNSKKNKYKYFIREIQDTSLLVTNSGVINYTSLAPGEYTLIVYAANGDGVWNKKPIELKIIIKPPFWQKIWFQIVAYSLLSFVIYSLIIFRIKAVKNQKKILEKLVKKRTNMIFAQKEEIEKQKAEIEKEKEKADKILYKIFPDKIAEKLKEKGKVRAELYNEATIIFADFIQFTKISSTLTPEKLVSQLNKYFKEFDKITVRNNLIQIKTIGDSYMAVGGIPKKNKTNAVDCVIASLQMQCFLNNLREEDNSTWEMRVGINTGEIVAGVLETNRPLYDIWGSAVNIASRIQDEGKARKVNISESTYRKVKPYFVCSSRGGILAKNVGVINMYFVDAIKAPLSISDEGKAPNANFWTYVNAHIDSKIKYAKLEEDFLLFLKENLPEKLYYHSVAHTEDVVEAVERIGMGEGVFDENLILLKTAALIHDAGFIKQYVDNETIGVEYAKEFLPKYGYKSKQINLVCDLILATRIDFEPKNNLHKIIKDADLDYLGRDDFEEISNTLFQELLEKGILKSKEDWDKMQIIFFKNHRYYTKYSQNNRVKKKQLNKILIKNSELIS